MHGAKHGQDDGDCAVCRMLWLELNTGNLSHLELTLCVIFRIKTNQWKSRCAIHLRRHIHGRICIRVVFVRIRKQHIEQHGTGTKVIELLQAISQHIARPRPTPMFLGQCRKGALIDVNNQDLVRRLRA